MNRTHLYCWQMMYLFWWLAPIRNKYQTVGCRQYLNILDLPVWVKHLAPAEAAIFCIECPILHRDEQNIRTRLPESTFLVQNNGLFTFYTGKAILSHVWKHCFLHTYIIVSADRGCSRLVAICVITYHIFGWWRTVVQKYSHGPIVMGKQIINVWHELAMATFSKYWSSSTTDIFKNLSLSKNKIVMIRKPRPVSCSNVYEPFIERDVFIHKKQL